MELKGKKGIYFTMDALLASFLLIAGILFIMNNPFYEQNTEQKSFISQDILNSLYSLKITEINHEFVEDEINNNNITRLNNSVLEQIGEYWTIGDIDKANYLFEIVVNHSLGDNLGLRLTIEDEEIFSKQLTNYADIASSSRMITGITKGGPITGFSSSAYLKKIRNKKTSSYAYFGGFVGQGNITRNFYLPTDFEPEKLISAELKIETPGQFTLNINGISCGTTYTGEQDVVSLWDLKYCNSSMHSGKNEIKINFISELNKSYISGGFFKVTYTTDTINENKSSNINKYEFPGIEGFINLYDSISAQGLITEYILNITFYSEYDAFLSIGNETIFYAPGSNETRNIFLNKQNLTLPPTQIPLRMSIINLSNITVLEAGLPSDTILVTDTSGSMSQCVDYENQNVEYCGYEYRFIFWWIYTECVYPGTCVSNECGGGSTTRNHVVFNKTSSTCAKNQLDYAKDSGKLFVEEIIDTSNQNKVGLVNFSTRGNSYIMPTNIKEVLNNEIDSYVYGGGTCTCCGLNRARTLINNSDNNKFIILISDGEPTYYCNGFEDYLGSAIWGGDSSGGSSSSTDIQWAIDAGQRACQENITVFTIGFGETMTSNGHNIMRQIACNESLYFDSTNASILTSILMNISDIISLQANFSSQTVTIAGNFTNTRIEDNSYIEIFYTPLIEYDLQNKLSLSFETEQFETCNPSIYIPENILINEAYLTSFSGDKWSKEALIKNSNQTTEFLFYNLTDYGSDYSILGDPFLIQIPSLLIVPGEYNNLSLLIGESPSNNSLCSPNNTLIYNAFLESSTVRTSVLEKAEGCNWKIESESGQYMNLKIPSNYAGNNNCTYNSVDGINFNPIDSYDFAVFELLKMLDPDLNNKVLINFIDADLEITLTTIEQVPYLWGPSLIKVEVSQ